MKCRHEDPDNTGQCIHCDFIFDETDRAIDEIQRVQRASRHLDQLVTVRFTGEVSDKLREVAKQMDLPYTNLVRLAVTRFLALPDEWQPRVDIVYREQA